MPQHGGDFRIEIFQLLSRVLLQPVIELASPAQDPHHNLGGQLAIRFLELGNLWALEEVDGKVTARLDTAEDSIGRLAGGRDGHNSIMNYER